MPDCWFVQACLEEKCVPESRDKHPPYLYGGPTSEPLEALPLLRVRSKDGDTCWWSESDAVVFRSIRILAMPVGVAAPTEYPIPIADATGRDTTATSCTAFVTLDLSNPACQISFSCLFGWNNSLARTAAGLHLGPAGPTTAAEIAGLSTSHHNNNIIIYSLSERG